MTPWALEAIHTRGWPLMGSSLASGGLLSMPYLDYYPLMVGDPLPRHHILLIKSLEIRSAVPPARRSCDSLPKEPLSAVLPLPFDSMQVWPLIYIFQPARRFCKILEEEQHLTRQACSMPGPDPFFEHRPVGVDVPPDVSCL